MFFRFCSLLVLYIKEKNSQMGAKDMTIGPDKTKKPTGFGTGNVGTSFSTTNTNNSFLSNTNSNTTPSTKTISSDPESPFMFSELGYLFAPNARFNNYDNQNTIETGLNPKGDYTVIFKSKNANNTAGIVNYIKEQVNKAENQNPYEALLNEFSSEKKRSMRLKPSDFAYLTHLGVYPINRLWILRRYRDQDVVPNNLDEWGSTGPTPISTLVGWIKPGDDDMMSVTFGETWVTTTAMLHEKLIQIMKEEFKLDVNALTAVPACSRGLLFTFLNKMGITSDEWGVDAIPVGDPDVLRVGATRMDDPGAGFGLTSSVKITLETSYEMKFIGDVDPGSAMLDIYDNIVYMGTSNTKYIMKDRGPIINAILNAANQPNNAQLWLDVISKLVEAFMGAVRQVFNEAISLLEGGDVVGKEPEQLVNIYDDEGNIIHSGRKNQKVSSSDTIWEDYLGNKIEIKDGIIINTNFGGVPKKEGETTEKKGIIDNLKKTVGGALDTVEGFVSDLTDAALQSNLLKSILTSTIAIYRWPLKGSIALMTGLNSTPWHLTMGNPFSPFISLGNVVVENIQLSFANEFGYNDMPNRINVNITARLGRSLGAQEILRMFNNGYQRFYNNKTKTFSKRSTNFPKNK